jgi:hypothetical protein
MPYSCAHQQALIRRTAVHTHESEERRDCSWQPAPPLFIKEHTGPQAPRRNPVPPPEGDGIETYIWRTRIRALPTAPRAHGTLSPGVDQLLRDIAATITTRAPRLPADLQRQLKYWGTRLTQVRDSFYVRRVWQANEAATDRWRGKVVRAPHRLRLTVHTLGVLCVRRHNRRLTFHLPGFVDIPDADRYKYCRVHLNIDHTRGYQILGIYQAIQAQWWLQTRWRE